MPTTATVNTSGFLLRWITSFSFYDCFAGMHHLYLRYLTTHAYKVEKAKEIINKGETETKRLQAEIEKCEQIERETTTRLIAFKRAFRGVQPKGIEDQKAMRDAYKNLAEASAKITKLGEELMELNPVIQDGKSITDETDNATLSTIITDLSTYGRAINQSKQERLAKQRLESKAELARRARIKKNKQGSSTDAMATQMADNDEREQEAALKADMVTEYIKGRHDGQSFDSFWDSLPVDDAPLIIQQEEVKEHDHATVEIMVIDDPS